LSSGNGKALQAILQQASARLDAGKTGVACSDLRAFMNQVDALVRAGQLSAADGQRLRDSAASIRTNLNC